MLAELREMVEGDGDGSEFPHYHEIMAQIKECPCQHTSPVFLCQHVVSTWIQAIRCHHIYLMNLSTSYHFSNLFKSLCKTLSKIQEVASLERVRSRFELCVEGREPTDSCMQQQMLQWSKVLCRGEMQHLHHLA